MMKKQRSIAIVGGGISGLSAAYRLLTEARKRDLALKIQVLESSERFGGTIQTTHEAGCLIEHGPDCFLFSKPAGVSLCKELGLEESLIGTNEEHRRSFVLRDNALLPVPSGFYLLAPISMISFLKTPIFSWAGKLRMCLDLFIPRRSGHSDESLASFVRRRLGKEALERMAQPMLAGIYSSDPEKLSLQATFPVFQDMENRYRSIILGLRRQARMTKEVASTSGPRYGLFVSLREGMESLVSSILEHIPKDSLHLGCKVIGLEHGGGKWRILRKGKNSIEVDAVCLTTSAGSVSRLLESAAPELSNELKEITYGSIGTLNLIFKKKQLHHSLNGMGFVVPEVENQKLLACTFSSTKFANRAPQDHVILRAFYKGMPRPERYSGRGGQIGPILEELRSILGIQGNPEVCIDSWYPNLMPQYHVGHLARVRRIEERVKKLPNLAIAGSGYRGVGIPDCIDSANRATNQILDSLDFG